MTKKLPESLLEHNRKWELYEDVDYDIFWNDQDKKYQGILEKYLISRMLPEKGMRIIDVGCGYGRLYDCYKNRFSMLILFDGSIRLLKKAMSENRESRSNVYFVAGDVNHLPFREASFDCVLMIRVLQHLFNLEITFQEMHRVLSKAGEFIFSYHNKQNLHRIVNWLLQKEKDNPFSKNSKEVSPALISHNPDYIKKSLTKAGFELPYYLGAVCVRQIASLTEKFSSGVPPGNCWARFMGKFWLAPWMIGKTRPRKSSELIEVEKLSDILTCPICKISVQEAGESYLCPICRRRFPVTDGILDFRPY